MPLAPDLIGVALDGRYELHVVIGEGTFGRVYRGRDRRLARDVAIKVIKPWWAEDPDWAGNFEREAQLLASLSDPGIVQIYDVGLASEGLYYVAELVDGESLATRLRGGRLPAAEACAIAEQLARALARAHAQGVVHRDVKPANVLLSADGRVKVGDFGVARLAEGSTDGGAGTVAGTPRYMAPEQARGNATSPATDVYGVGIVLYEMLAGRPPFDGQSAVDLALRHAVEPPPPLPADVPAGLSRIVGRALAKDPVARFPDGSTMAAELARAQASLRPGPHRNGSAPSREQHAPANGVAATRVGEPMTPRRNVNPSARRQRIALFGLVLLLGFGMVAAALALAPGHLTVPNLRGMSSARVRSAAKRVGFHPLLERRYSDAPAGSAIAQSPAAGTRVAGGATVRVLISAGPAPVNVPQLAHNSQGAAESLLQQLKLRAAIAQVPAPGVSPGTVTGQLPGAGARLAPGSTVSLSVAETPRWRSLISVSGSGSARSVPFRIRGDRWQIVYSMGYQGVCTFVFFCSGPTARVSNAGTRTTIDQFDLGEGSGQTRTFKSGPSLYEISIASGSDSARWAIRVEDYY